MFSLGKQYYVISGSRVFIPPFFIYLFFPDCVASRSDVVFVVDDSTSVQRSNFRSVLGFVQGVVEALTIGPDAVLIGFTSFSNRVQHQFYLKDYTDKTELKTAIENVKFRGGGTNIEGALSAAYHDQFLSTANGARDSATKVLVLITDGTSPGTETVSKTIRDAGIIIVCVGITTEIDLNQLISIADDATRVFDASSFSELNDIQDSLISKTCEGKY